MLVNINDIPSKEIQIRREDKDFLRVKTKAHCSIL